VTARLALALAVVAVARTAASAGPRVDLTVRPGATPHHLRMRRTSAVPSVTPAPATPAPAPAVPADAAADPAPDPAATPAPANGAIRARTPRASDFDLVGVRRADDKVVFRLDLGFGVDGAAISGRRALAGEPLSSKDFREVRAQGFGNLFVGTRGLAIAPLSSYLSLGFRLTPGISQIAPLADSLDSTRDIQVRAGWAEATNFLPGKLLRSVRVRAGRQYAYGPWPIHFDGTVAAWTSKALQLSALAGVRVDDYAPTDDTTDAPSVAALIAAVDLGALGRAPVTVRGTLMWLSDRRFADLELGYRPRRGLVAVGGIRWIANRAARERATIRAQVSDVTHVVFDFEHRHATDWRWDPSFVDPTAPGSAKPYLELPVTIPQVRFAIRAGTVLLDNIDLYLRAAAAVDLAPRPDEQTGFAEIGGAIEIRVRRTLALTASAVGRDYELTNAPVAGTAQLDVGNVIGPLIDPTNAAQVSSIGQESFIEGGAGLRYSTGARRFSATAEFYARRSKYAGLYADDTPDIGDAIDLKDLRGGGRFSLDGWMSPRLRLHLEYDVTTTLDNAPEINGWKVLRALAEGSF